MRPHPTMPLIFVNSDSPLRPERGCGVSAINKSCWGEALMTNEPNDEVSDLRFALGNSDNYRKRHYC